MPLRNLPSVHELARDLAPSGLPERLRVLIAREAVEQARTELRAGGEADPTKEAMSTAQALARRSPTSVVNATGVIIHTNLGRVPLHADAVLAAAGAAEGYGNVEFDLATGERGGRSGFIRLLLTELTGADDALVLGNNAGALYAVLNVLASRGEVPVSRGELIEIGGSYRLPDLIRASGAVMVEVGTTNRTRASDYAAVVGPITALLLKVHPSNYEIIGFSEQADLAGLRQVADEAGVPLVFDAGSGLMDEATPWLPGGPPPWLQGEPGIRQAAAIADLTMFSGDKLLGGPQAGIIVGRRDLVETVRSHPISRAMRVDGSTLAALATTLGFYADGRAAELPVWAMATADLVELTERAQVLAAAIGASVEDGLSMVGGGSTPGRGIPSPLVRLAHGDRAYRTLLDGSPPVLARREAGDLLVDLRTVPPSMDRHLADLLSP